MLIIALIQGNILLEYVLIIIGGFIIEKLYAFKALKALFLS